MVNNESTQLNLIFSALADETRRSVLTRLEKGSATISELAQSHDMSLPGFMKHLAVLETAGLIARSKAGRVVHCTLEARTMQEAAIWIARYERFWTEQLDALGRYLYHQEEVSPWKAPNDKTESKSGSSDTTPSCPSGSGKPGPRQKR